MQGSFEFWGLKASSYGFGASYRLEIYVGLTSHLGVGLCVGAQQGKKSLTNRYKYNVRLINGTSTPPYAKPKNAVQQERKQMQLTNQRTPKSTSTQKLASSNETRKTFSRICSPTPKPLLFVNLTWCSALLSKPEAFSGALRSSSEGFEVAHLAVPSYFLCEGLLVWC